MKFSDIQMLQRMIDRRIEEKKIITYFSKQGYSEKEVLNEISSYDYSKRADKSMRAVADLPTFSGEENRIVPTKRVPGRKDMHQNIAMMILFGALAIIALVGIYSLLQ